MNRIFIVLILIVSCVIPTVAVAANQVASFTGNADKLTTRFKVKGPWLLRWNLGSDYPKEAGLDVSLINAVTGVHQSTVLKKQNVGNGLRLMQNSGEFRFRVDATLARWALQVQEITEAEVEELELVTPQSKTPWIRQRK